MQNPALTIVLAQIGMRDVAQLCLIKLENFDLCQLDEIARRYTADQWPAGVDNGVSVTYPEAGRLGYRHIAALGADPERLGQPLGRRRC